MDFKDLDIKHSYISYGEENIISSLVAPSLRYAKSYKRSVGFFSSSVFNVLADQIISLVRNQGKIKMICGPQLSEEDGEAISVGYKYKQDVIEKIFSEKFEDELDKLSEKNLRLLAELIAKGYMEIKLAITKGVGIYHDKLGILEDLNGNRIVFYGSANSSEAAYINNYEKIRVSTSWWKGFEPIIEDEEKEFDSLWDNTNPYVEVSNFSKKACKIIDRKITEKAKEKASKSGIVLRDYQEQAINAWKNNAYVGFYVMATGTGKTWTAIYSAKELLEHEKCDIVICAPYKHLVKQWYEDVVKVFPDAKYIMVSSENPQWELQLNEELIRSKYKKDNQIIVISTIMSFSMPKFQKIINKSINKRLLIVDEAHRYKKFDDDIKDQYQYRLGLSATPGNGKNQEFVKELLEFFGGVVFELPIENALERGYLVPYYYHPIFVNATYEEESRFEYYSKKMAACFVNGKCVDVDSLVKYSRSRLRIISMASEKEERIDEILDEIKEEDHFVVYCGDGKLFDNNRQAEVRHIQFIKSKLNERGKKASQFTATENMNKRMELVDGFNKNEFDSLVAIRCLDEGINIPSIKGALILSSNDDYREFVQRRGRILRLYPNKQFANIYDVLVMPSYLTPGMAAIELRRFYEYAKLALNADVNMEILNEQLSLYGLDYSTINMFEGVEEDMDE